MVFHGDYEVEFEIYEKRESDWGPKLLGHMVGINSEDAKARWMEAHQISHERLSALEAVPAIEECR
jgi:hypothetical protein